VLHGTQKGCTCNEKGFSYGDSCRTLFLRVYYLISLTILICYTVSLYGGYYGVAICEMVSAIIFFVVFMMEMDKTIQVVNWVWSDLLRASTGTAMYLISSLMDLIRGAGDGAHIAGVVSQMSNHLEIFEQIQMKASQITYFFSS
uniref:Proteolipid protein 2 n=1 Tax=Oncorhynchus tshawytscha TaxID=74940 RepID=A0AAZ3S5Z4_ONCTS